MVLIVCVSCLIGEVVRWRSPYRSRLVSSLTPPSLAADILPFIS